MRKIYLLRHAQAESGFNSPDIERTLTEQGRKQALQVGIFLKNHEIDHMLCSSAVRTQETLKGIQKAGVEFGKINILDKFYNAPADVLREELEDTERNVLVIAHNPGIHQLAFQMAQAGHEDYINGLAMGYSPATLSIFEDGQIIDLIVPE